MQTYEQDLNARAQEQARLLRAGRFDLLDIKHIASRMAVLLAHLLKWQHQPERRGASWERPIKAQRKDILHALDESPSLAPKLEEPRWLDMVWA